MLRITADTNIIISALNFSGNPAHILDTLRSSNFDVAYRVVLKQIMPQVINSVRRNLKPLACLRATSRGPAGTAPHLPVEPDIG